VSPPRGGGPRARREAGDAVPEGVVARAKAAYGHRSTAPVAALVFDSADQDDASEERVLCFEHGGAARVELWVAQDGDRRSLRGRVHPPPARVELELEGAGVTLVDAAPRAAFGFEGVPHGVMRLHLVGRRGVDAVPTEWFLT
jgi:hypothetical protein